ncbi:MAG: MATE family efflux transporter, partial [Coprobacillus sp.]
MEKRNPMGYKPIFPLLLSMAFPPMISMLIQSLYNIVDSIFVAQLSEEALTAVSLIYPLQNLSLAVCCGIGIAMNALIARHLGANNDKEASYVASQGMLMTLLHSLIFVIIGLFFIQPFVSMFTTSSTVIDYGVQYGSIVITLTFGSFIHIAIEKMFQATGNMIVPMFLQLIGAIVNIVLDPILIFGY